MSDPNVFFDFLEPEGNQGFSKGSFKALFAPLKGDQARRRALATEAA